MKVFTGLSAVLANLRTYSSDLVGLSVIVKCNRLFEWDYFVLCYYQEKAPVLVSVA